jgi:hypothetical protein
MGSWLVFFSPSGLIAYGLVHRRPPLNPHCLHVLSLLWLPVEIFDLINGGRWSVWITV